MRPILFVFLILFSATICAAEDILVAFLTTDSKLVVLKVNFANGKYTIVDRAVFPLSRQGGLTALSTLSDGNFQVAWNQQDNTNKIKAFSMALGSSLDAVGGIKTNPPVLSAFYNFNILPDGNQFSVDQSNNVTLRSRASNGNMGGSQGKLFTLPQGFDPIDTSFGRGAVVGANTNQPLVNNVPFFTLSYIQSQRRYGFTMFAPDRSGLTTKQLAAGPVSGVFGGEVISTEMTLKKEDFSDLAAFFWLLFVERTPSASNSPNAAVKLIMKSQKIDAQTLRPEGNSIVLVSPKPGDLLGSVVFFNMFTITTEQPSVGAAGIAASTGAHVFYVEQTSSCRSTSLKAFHMSTETGKKNSGFSTLLSCSDPIIQPGNKFLYGLSAYTVPGS